jgi:hypothetical protein
MRRWPEVMYVKRDPNMPKDVGLPLICSENITALGEGEIAVYRLEMREELINKKGEKTP